MQSHNQRKLLLVSLLGDQRFVKVNNESLLAEGSSKTFDTKRKISRKVNEAVVTFLRNEVSRLQVTGSITGLWTNDTSALNSEKWAVGKG